MSWDEALGLPTEEAVLLALRTQQIVAHESGVARTADPLGGSYYVEALTDELERRVTALIERDRGAAAASSPASRTARSSRRSPSAAYRQQRQIEDGERAIVGVNRFVEDEARGRTSSTFQVGEDVLDRQLARLAATRARARSSERGRGGARPSRRRRARQREHDAGDRRRGAQAYATRRRDLRRARRGVFGHHEARAVV